MEVKYERCCGIDVHKQSVTTCLIAPNAEGQVVKVKRSFGTMTDDLKGLAAWLQERQVTTVALESTGVDWKGRLRFWSSIPNISRSWRAARPMWPMPNGSPTCCAMAC